MFFSKTANTMKRAITALLSILLITSTLCAQSVGLVLSGGGAKGITHIGIIQALEEHGIPIDYVTGTSIGAIYPAGDARPDRIEGVPTMLLGKNR